MKKKYFSLFALLAIIPAVIYGIENQSPQYNDGKLTTVSTGFPAVISDEEQMRLSDIVVRGKIIDVQKEVGYLDADRGIVKVYSVYTLEPQKFIKGNAEGNLIVKVLGGETENYRTIAEYMELANEDRVFMHLTLSDDGTHYNVFGGVYTTYLLENGIARNSQLHHLFEAQLERSLEDLAKKQG